MPRIALSVPLADVPDLFRSAVRAVDRAVLVEVTEDRGRVGRRTNFAAKSEVTLFTFRAVSETTSEVRAVSTTGGVFGDLASYPDVVLETGRAVLDELSRRAGSASR